MNEFNEYLWGTCWGQVLGRQGLLPGPWPASGSCQFGGQARVGQVTRGLQPLGRMEAEERLPEFRKRPIEQCKGHQSRNEQTLSLCHVGREEGRREDYILSLKIPDSFHHAHPMQTLLYAAERVTFLNTDSLGSLFTNHHPYSFCYGKLPVWHSRPFTE